MIEYSLGSIDDMEEVIDLCASWWYDSAFYENTGMEFKIDRGLYEQLSEMESLFSVIGRNEHGKVVACYVSAIAPYMFNPEWLSSSEVVWCIDKKYRKAGEVLNLLAAIEAGLTQAGVRIFNLNFPVHEGRERLAKKLEDKLGYFVQDLSIMKEIKYG